MLTPSQTVFLESLLGPNGQIIQAIRNFKGLSTALKILYLNRAIHLEAEAFLVTIDKLFPFNLPNDQFQALLDFVLLLKFINDICFDNLIATPNHAAYPAIHFYLSTDAYHHYEIQDATQKMIQEHISELSALTEPHPSLEIHLRVIVEKDIPQNMEWRAYSNLPDHQRPLLEPKPRKVSNANLFFNHSRDSKTKEMFHEHPDFLSLDLSIRLQILKHFEHFSSLGKANVSLDDIAKLSTEEREDILSNAPHIIPFLTAMHMSFNNFMKIPRNKRDFYLEAFTGIHTLSQQIHSLSAPLQAELLPHLKTIYHLCYMIKMPLEQQLVLNDSFRQIIYHNMHKINQLILQHKIPLDQIITLSTERLELFIVNFEALNILLEHKTVDFTQLNQMNTTQIKEMLIYADAFKILTEQKHFKLYDLLQCAPGNRSLLLSHAQAALYLISSDAALAQELLEMPEGHLLEALTHPNDDENLDLILPSADSCLIL